MSRTRLLLDCDGVVANLVRGFRSFVNEKFGLSFDPNDVVYHNRMGRSPKLAGIHQELLRWFPVEADEEYNGFGGAFRCFMKDRDVYGQWVEPVEGAVEAVAELREHYDVKFITAMMRSARDHYRSKMEWIERWFPGLPIITCPSEEKYLFGQPDDHAVDDRYDTCTAWRSVGVQSMIFRQPWNEIPADLTIVRTFDWDGIRKELL